MAPTRVALVGLGAIAETHLSKLARIDGVEVAGICDLSETLLEAVRERFVDAPPYTDFGRLLDEVEPDAVHVLTPPASHRELTLAALARGSHVFVEKPAAPSLEEYREMREAASERGLLLVENLNYRFQAPVVRALELLREGAIGELVHVAATMGVGVADERSPYADRDLPHFGHDLPGGALRNFASHPASLAVAAMGDYERLRVSMRTLRADLASPDELRALVEGPAATALVTVTGHAKPAVITMTIEGTAGSIEVDVIDQRVHLERAGSAVARLTGALRHGAGYVTGALTLAGRAATARHDYHEGFERLLRGFYASLRDGGPPPLEPAEMDTVNRMVADLFDPKNAL